MIDNIVKLNQEKLERIVGRPPADAQLRNALLFEYCFEPGAAWHSRKKIMHSRRMQDYIFYFKMVNHTPGDARKIHWCWDDKTQAPCCKTSEEAISQTVKAETGVFVNHGFPKVSQAKFTGYDTALSISIAAHSKHSVFPRAFNLKERDSLEEADVLNATDFGSGAADFKKLNLGRVRNVCEVHNNLETRWSMPIIKITGKPISNINRAMMGHDRQRPSLHEVATHNVAWAAPFPPPPNHQPTPRRHQP